ncbi:MAG: adenine deaminase C-terminal domain-containing protein [Desulfobacterales bacterium]
MRSRTDRDILKLAVIERHTGSGNIVKGFDIGFGLKKGPLPEAWPDSLQYYCDGG